MVTMALSCLICEIKRHGRKSLFFSYPLTFDSPVRGVLVRVLPPRLVWRKIEWCGYPTVKKLRICETVDRILECDGRTDILPRHSPRYAYASRGKKWEVRGDPGPITSSAYYSLHTLRAPHTDMVRTAAVQMPHRNLPLTSFQRQSFRYE